MEINVQKVKVKVKVNMYLLENKITFIHNP